LKTEQVEETVSPAAKRGEESVSVQDSSFYTFFEDKEAVPLEFLFGKIVVGSELEL